MPILEVRLEGKSRSRRIRLDGPAIHIGRAPDNEIIVRDKRVSRRHLEIQYDGTTAHLRDLGSTFGTTVNGGATEACTLHDGDQIRIGSSMITFMDEAEEIADSDEIVSFENGQAPATSGPSQEAIADRDPGRAQELEASLHERDQELARLHEELEELRQQASSKEDYEDRLAVLNEKAERLESSRDELRKRAEVAEDESDALQTRLEQQQQVAAHASDDRENLRLREKLDNAHRELHALRQQLQHRESMLSEVRQEIDADLDAQAIEPVDATSGFPDDASPRAFIPIEDGRAERGPVLAELIRAKDVGPFWEPADRDYGAWILAAMLGLIGLGVFGWALLA